MEGEIIWVSFYLLSVVEAESHRQDWGAGCLNEALDFLPWGESSFALRILKAGRLDWVQGTDSWVFVNAEAVGGDLLAGVQPDGGLQGPPLGAHTSFPGPGPVRCPFGVHHRLTGPSLAPATLCVSLQEE